MKSALLLICLVISQLAYASDDILWQPKAARVPAAVTDAEQQYQQQPNNLVVAANLVEQYLALIRRTDSREFLQKARTVQAQVTEVSDANSNVPWLIASADLYQYQHQFAAAQQVLQQLLAVQPKHLRATLMQARIALTQGNTKQAHSLCAGLLGHQALGIVSTCLLEVEGRSADTQQAYRKLALLQQRSNGQVTSSVVQQWRLQILAEQAFVLGQFQQARQWLTELPQPIATVERKLLLDSYLFEDSSNVPKALVENCSAAVVDAIAIRFAFAQQNQGGGCWVDYAQQRMRIREARKDKLHSADIAYYYTYVDPQPSKALHWAQINYSVAKEPLDLALLNDAKALVAGQGNSGNPNDA